MSQEILRRTIGLWTAWRSQGEGRRLAKIDHAGLPEAVPSIDASIEACMGWLSRAQGKSRTADGGVARVYSLVDGWQSSYPETTGYIIPTFLELARRRSRADWRERARDMLDWLVRIQFADGAFQGGMVDSHPVVPVAFNTGQILIGLAAGERELGGYERPLRMAADWLVQHQEVDGCWRRGASPFAMSGEKSYDTHIGYGLLEAARVLGDERYVESAFANALWSLNQQTSSGWLDKCCLSHFHKPLTHTLGYALRGLLEAHRFRAHDRIRDGAIRLANGLLGALRDDGFLPGELRSDWSAAATWACLTGTAQIGHCWLMLFQDTGERRYLDAGRLATQYVRRTLAFSGPPDQIGGVRGSFPIDGAYCRYEYPNWAAKFLVDALVLEQDVLQRLGLPESTR